jgi:hypothetical protein
VKKIYLIIFLIFILLNQVSAQQNSTWIAFWNKNNTLIGFKDQAGKVKIAPSIDSWIKAIKFDCIIAVSKEENGKIESYYLTKNSRIVGRDSLYIFDNGPDCESEGFIRFRDKITHKVGLFNSKGDIEIPADYDDLTPVRNGMVIAAKGGRWDASQLSEDNQYSWVGSKEMLIDVHNKILIAAFPYNENLNFFSLIISQQADKNPIRQNFKAVDGEYYSFINFEKEFKLWLKDSLFNHLTKSKMPGILYKNITFWYKPKGWVTENKERFLQKNFRLISSELTALRSSKCNYEVFKEDLNPYIYNSNSKEFQKYYDNCGTSKSWIYPVETVVITHQAGHNISQDQFGFLRTDVGYKLIEISITSDNNIK